MSRREDEIIPAQLATRVYRNTALALVILQEREADEVEDPFLVFQQAHIGTLIERLWDELEEHQKGDLHANLGLHPDRDVHRLEQKLAELRMELDALVQSKPTCAPAQVHVLTQATKPGHLLRGLIADVEASGFALTELLAMAGVDRSTWFRWKAGGVSPSLDNYEAVRGALLTLAHQTEAQRRLAEEGRGEG